MILRRDTCGRAAVGSVTRLASGECARCSPARMAPERLQAGLAEGQESFVQQGLNQYQAPRVVQVAGNLAGGEAVAIAYRCVSHLVSHGGGQHDRLVVEVQPDRLAADGDVPVQVRPTPYPGA